MKQIFPLNFRELRIGSENNDTLTTDVLEDKQIGLLLCRSSQTVEGNIY